MREHCGNAEAVAEFLAGTRMCAGALSVFRTHPQHALARSQMEGGGGVVTFEVDGGKRERSGSPKR